MTELSKKEMEEILLLHEIAELEMDVEATLATLAPNPHYELASLGLAIDGIDAVRETYRRILPNLSRDVAAEKRVHAVAGNTLLREAHMSFNNLDDEPARRLPNRRERADHRQARRLQICRGGGQDHRSDPCRQLTAEPR